MKIALFTFWHIHNYGAEMQAYATIKALKQLRHNVEIINFDFKKSEARGFKNKLHNFVRLFTPLNLKAQWFWKKYFPSVKYNSIKELQDNPPLADIYLVGSDQVWNLEITKGSYLVYFLDFGHESTKRISYGSSIGLSQWNFGAEQTENVDRLLKRFSSISCRENEGIKILKDVFRVDAIKVLDPTMLFDNYNELTGKLNHKNTLVYYPLFPNKEVKSFSKDLAKSLKLDFEENGKTSTWIRGMGWNRNSVPQWISSIAQGQFIISQSFHGTVFSILYKRQFIVIYNGNKASRIIDLLRELGLLDRYFRTVEDAKASKIWEYQIDYNKIDKALSILRKKSWEYLRNCLKNN